MNINERLWETFSKLIKRVQEDHMACGAFGKGHDFYHALVVAQYATLIAEKTKFGFLGWIAGICHNVDHLYPGEDIRRIVWSYLETTDIMLSDDEKIWIVETVVHHSEPNHPADDALLQTLKDADQLGNLNQIAWIRMGQFRPGVPAVDPRFIGTSDPAATFKNPKAILDNIRCTLEWEKWLRLPKAKELGKPMFEQIRLLLKDTEHQFETLGLLPFPPELVVESAP